MDKILKGAARRPAVEQPTKFELVINPQDGPGPASPSPQPPFQADEVIRGCPGARLRPWLYTPLVSNNYRWGVEIPAYILCKQNPSLK
jgi:hypothetical protein